MVLTLSRFVPMIVTLVPTGPEAGENDVIVGGRATSKFRVVVAVPPGVVTASLPGVAVIGTDVVICVPASLTSKSAPGAPTLTPLNVTCVAPVNEYPKIVTGPPRFCCSVLTSVILGTTLNVPLLCGPSPAASWSWSFPVTAVAGIVTLIWLPDWTGAPMSTPPRVTPSTYARFVPLMVTVVPAVPELGENELTAAGRTT